ncbi:hypothetical protein [uncultured Thiodictyon sp.]|uniref:hypothetical protein n=1 Tax=uncultured Thiodictyon sp. TaxID=1846217 RepID=UPI0025EE7C7B|nr:hypothetical protein [uncultured Thiodictyon sp.]
MHHHRRAPIRNPFDQDDLRHPWFGGQQRLHQFGRELVGGDRRGRHALHPRARLAGEPFQAVQGGTPGDGAIRLPREPLHACPLRDLGGLPVERL